MTANPRALIATIVVLVVTPIFGLFVAPLLTLAPSGTAHAQEGPSIEIEFDPEGTVVAWVQLDRLYADVQRSDWLHSEFRAEVRVNVVGSGNPSVTECESGNAFSDTVGIGTISSGTATATGTIPDTCSTGHHILVASLYDSDDDEIISTARGFVVSSIQSLELPSGHRPNSPAGLWGEYVQPHYFTNRTAGIRFHVVDSASSTVYAYDLPAYDERGTEYDDTNTSFSSRNTILHQPQIPGGSWSTEALPGSRMKALALRTKSSNTGSSPTNSYWTKSV